MPVLYILVFALASHIYTLSYLLGPLFNNASLLNLLFLFLGMLPLYFLPLLALFGAFRLLSPIVLTRLQLRLFLPILASALLTPMYFFSVGLVSVMLQ